MWRGTLAVLGCSFLLACGSDGTPGAGDAGDAAGSVTEDAAEPATPSRLQAVDRARDVSRAAEERAARMDSLQR